MYTIQIKFYFKLNILYLPKYNNLILRNVSNTLFSILHVYVKNKNYYHTIYHSETMLIMKIV